MIRIPAVTCDNLILSQAQECNYPPVDKEIIHSVTDSAADGCLPAEQALRLLDAIGISRQKEIIATSATEAKYAATDIGYPINLKSISAHDNSLDEAVEDVSDENTLKMEFRRLVLSSDVKGVMLGPSLKGARAYFGVRRSAKWGHLVVCGTFARNESRPDNFVFCTMPVTRAEAQQMFARVKGDLQLNELSFVETLCRLSALCNAAPEIERMDIMPAVANARCVVALDTAVCVKKTIES